MELKRILLQGALVAGFPEEQWTLKRVGAVIEERFAFGLDPSQVRRILVEKLKWTHHRPEKKSFERREREIGQMCRLFLSMLFANDPREFDLALGWWGDS